MQTLMNKYFGVIFLAVCVIIVYVICNEKSQTIDVPDKQQETLLQEKIDFVKETEISADTWENSVEEENNVMRLMNEESLRIISEKIETEELAIWIKTELGGNGFDWFSDYNGKKVQRILDAEGRVYSPSVSPDIIFYQAKESETLEAVAERMIESMISPLTEPIETRAYTIVEYTLGKQELISVSEKIWVLPYINGYYSYDGIDLVAMETYLEEEPLLEQDGLMPFQRQGSPLAFVYILMKEGDIYRLQRAVDMMSVSNSLMSNE